MIPSSGGSGPGVWGQSNRGRQEGLHLLKYQRSATIVGCHTKVVTIGRPKKVIFVGQLCDFSENIQFESAVYH